jgi:hypothetical protein
MRKLLLLPVLILIAFRLSYAQQENTGIDISPDPVITESFDKEIKSDFYKPLNLKDNTDLNYEWNKSSGIRGLQYEPSQ